MIRVHSPQSIVHSKKLKTHDARRKTQDELGFTLIEVIIAITIIAVIMIPVAMICMEHARSAAFADSVTIATNLGRHDIAIVNNVSYASVANSTVSDYVDSRYAADLDRIVSVVGNRKLVRSRILRHNTTEELAELDTYVMNVSFGAGSGGGVSGAEASSFSVSGDTLSDRDLTDISIGNSRTTGNITITALKINPSINKTLDSIEAGLDDDINRLASSVSLSAGAETQVDIGPYLIIPSNTTYTGSNALNLGFDKTDTDHEIEIKFVFSDYPPSESGWYIWSYDSKKKKGK